MMVPFVSLRLDFSDMFERCRYGAGKRMIEESNRGEPRQYETHDLRGQRWGCADQISEARDGVRLVRTVRTRQSCTVLFSGTTCAVIG